MIEFILPAALLFQNTHLDTQIIDRDRLEIVLRRELYGVSGRNFRDASNAVFTRNLQTGSAASAQHSASMTWNFYSDGTECRLSSFYVYSEITLVYPHWVEVHDRSGRDRRRWDELFADFQVHEHGHADISIQMASALRNGMAALAPQPDCETLTGEIEALQADLADWEERNQLEYDRLTRHGLDQEDLGDWVAHDGATAEAAASE